jgi:hypothetical protein
MRGFMTAFLQCDRINGRQVGRQPLHLATGGGETGARKGRCPRSQVHGARRAPALAEMSPACLARRQLQRVPGNACSLVYEACCRSGVLEQMFYNRSSVPHRHPGVKRFSPSAVVARQAHLPPDGQCRSVSKEKGLSSKTQPLRLVRPHFPRKMDQMVGVEREAQRHVRSALRSVLVQPESGTNRW